MKKLLLLFILGFSTSIVFAGDQPKRTCATMNVLQELKKQDPALESRMQQIEMQAADYVKSLKSKGFNTVQSVITIPVVFHVVYRTSAENITNAQCQAQIDQLNRDFGRQNTDASNTPSAFSGVAADVGIQFCLATSDPNGNPTTGVERRQTTKPSFTTNDGVKYYSKGGLNAWPAGSYLNIWSCNLGNRLLGYAQFPGGKAATDGVVVLYSSVGSMAKPGTISRYNLGRTATHEVGHWLNLYHIWGDDGGSCSGTDKVSDTPNQAGENYGCPAFPRTDACNKTTPGVMFMNYMDYTDDGCMNMFTAGQASRCNSLFSLGGARAGLLSSSGCTTPAISVAQNTIERNTNAPQILAKNEMSVYPNPSHGSLNVAFNSTSTLDELTTIRILDLLGNVVTSQKVSVSAGSNKYSFDLSSTNKGIYFIELTNSSERLIQRLILDK